jgi:hypothetical protein
MRLTLLAQCIVQALMSGQQPSLIWFQRDLLPMD